MILLEREHHGGAQVLHKFANGYGASVVCNPYSYGYDEGLKELAVIKFQDASSDDTSFSLVYDTGITDDVLGYLTDEDVADVLVKIEALEAK